MRKNFIAAALVLFSLIALIPSLAAQSPPSFTGKWEGTFKMQRPDGTEGNPSNVVFNLTHKGKASLVLRDPPIGSGRSTRAPSTPAKRRSKCSSRMDRCSSSRSRSSRGVCRET